ncbi:dephospho-CoA kinase [Geobacter hydrogenophilus]|uniref:Dephospho-CoA kinase n=1 Tax=Geobacter hydrogenophilus TaxID=40983 RepID=A0A9W6FZ62_9BACT|nr:dephospho-CoA kinase [Geobacter hydrogenophilus]MBT0893777.1 dephospho-CoA kinase [Geobacter hydrogenophilus]GLI37525.1 dephospho-CoA kinase [Geobacter hydrogenophilus]
MLVIGLTGGIASGKSTVARILERLGATIIDADLLAREAVLPGTPAHEDIVAAFGMEILLPDATIDRKALGRIVFANPDARRRLEAITHPAIARLSQARLAEARRSDAPAVFYVAPLLIEAGATGRVDDIWVVYADRETQLARLTERDGIRREEAEQRLAAQMPMDEKASHGSAVIDNRGTPEETERQVVALWKERIEKSPR